MREGLFEYVDLYKRNFYMLVPNFSYTSARSVVESENRRELQLKKRKLRVETYIESKANKKNKYINTDGLKNEALDISPNTVGVKEVEKTNLIIQNVEGKATEKIILEELIDLNQDNMVLGIENQRDEITKDNQILLDSVGQEKNAALNETKDNTYESIDGLKKELRDSHKEIADISNQMRSLYQKMQDKLDYHKLLEAKMENFKIHHPDNDKILCKLCNIPIRKTIRSRLCGSCYQLERNKIRRDATVKKRHLRDIQIREC